MTCFLWFYPEQEYFPVSESWKFPQAFVFSQQFSPLAWMSHVRHPQSPPWRTGKTPFFTDTWQRVPWCYLQIELPLAVSFPTAFGRILSKITACGCRQRSTLKQLQNTSLQMQQHTWRVSFLHGKLGSYTCQSHGHHKMCRLWVNKYYFTSLMCSFLYWCLYKNVL